MTLDPSDRQLYAVDVDDSICYLASAVSPEKAIDVVAPMLWPTVMQGKLMPSPRWAADGLVAREPTQDEREHWDKQAAPFGTCGEFALSAIPYRKPRRAIQQRRASIVR